MKFRFYAIWLCVICVLVFLVQIFVKGFTDLFVLTPAAFYQPWRFVSAVFLHGGISHLLFNIFALGLFGSVLEGFIGSKRFLLVFFVTGIGANLVAVNFYPSSLGASGAIFGVIGCLILVRPLLVVWAFGMPMPIFVAGIIWVVGDVIGTFVPSGVGTIAHLAGIFFGMVFGLMYRKRFGASKVRNEKYQLDERAIREWEERNLR